MAITTVSLKSATFKIDPTTPAPTGTPTYSGDYSAQLIDVKLTVDSSGGKSNRKTLSGDVIPESLTFTDQLQGTVLQDWPAVGGGLIGLSRDPAHRGGTFAFQVTSVDPAGYTATGVVQMTPLDLDLNPNDTAEAKLDWKITTLAETYPTA